MWSIDRPDPVWVKTPEQANALIEKIARKGIAAIDTETTGLVTWRDTVLFWSLCTDLNDRYFLEEDMLPYFEKLFRNPHIIWVGTNTKYDAHMLRNSGFPLAGPLYCTITMDRLLYSDERNKGLKGSYERQFGEHVTSFEETFYPRNKNGIPYKPKNSNMTQILLSNWDQNPEKVIRYASLDAWMSWRLHKRLKKKLKAITSMRTKQNMWEIYTELEVPFTSVLLACEHNGVQIDTEYLEGLKEPMRIELLEIEKTLNNRLGTVFNVRSHGDVRELLFHHLKLKPVKRTKGGKASTDVEVLEQLSMLGTDEADIILRHRKLDKIKSTYVDKILNSVDPNGRLHGDLNQAGTATHRLSSSKPNMQNIPNPETDEFQIRKAFIPTPGNKLFAADYSQIEMFIMAHMSGDPGMIQSILDGKDLHAGNAALVWGVPYEEIIAAREKEGDLTDRERLLRGYRQYAKVVGFGQFEAEVKPAQNGETYSAAA